MFCNDLNNILSLIVATIFADKRIYDSEIDTFVKSTASLKIAKKLEPKLSRTRLLVWYDANQNDIRKKLETPYFKDWFYDLLDKLSEVQGKRAILKVMDDIARADGEVHVSERALITLAQRHWGITT